MVTDGPPATEGRIYWDGQQIAFRSWSSLTYFDHQDWEGTERARSDPWGKTRGQTERFLIASQAWPLASGCCR